MNLNTNTQEGHKVLVAPDPLGVIVTVVPRTPRLDGGINDVFTVRLRSTSILRSLSEMVSTQGYKSDDGNSTIFLKQGFLQFSFRYQHLPHSRFITRLSATDSNRVVNHLRALTEDPTRHEPNSEELRAPGHKVGRNETCPCCSGKKFKKCCGAPNAKPIALAMELEPFSASKDQVVQELLHQATQDISALLDADFWHELGCALGSSESHELAINAFDHALSIRPEDEFAAANRAVSIGILGKPGECLRILQKLPNKQGKAFVLIANVLQELGRHSEAVPYYEKAIAAEPDFFLPVRRLIDSLDTLDHPLLEYWINRAAKQFPKSPTIASAYCWYLLRTNRLEKLAESDWIDHLEVEADSERIIGRHSEDPKLIVEAQLFRQIGLAVKNEDAECLERGISILQAAPLNWHLCAAAHNLACVAAHLGRRDLVRSAGSKFCENCLSRKASQVYLQEQLARASCFAGDYTTALADCETGLRLEADCKGLLWTKCWSLDELGHTEEAIKVAQHLYKLDPRKDNLAYNLGYMCGRVGKLGLAVHYYESQIQLKGDHFQAIENLTPLRLMEGDLQGAGELFAKWTQIVERLTDTAAFQRKIASFSELHRFAYEHRGSPTLAREVKERNLSLDPIVGAEAAIPLKRPSHEELLVAVRNNNTDELNDIEYRFEMEKRGDFSPLAEKVASVFPEVKLLPARAYLSFLEGERLLDDDSRIDSSPAVLAFSKALEITLKNVVFDAFRNAIVGAPDFGALLSDAYNNTYRDAAKFTSFIKNGSCHELGGMAKTLNLCSRPIGGSMKLLIRFRTFVQIDLHLKAVLAPALITAIGDLARNYRNPAAHSQNFDKPAAQHVKGAVIPILKVVLTPVS